MLKILDVTMQNLAARNQRIPDVAYAKISFWLGHRLESDRSYMLKKRVSHYV
jgi:hypothetical protein